MIKRTLLIVGLLGLLNACVTASRSYNDTTENVTRVSDSTINTDHLQAIKFSIAANKTWQNSGIFLENGHLVHVTASGSWSPAPLLLAWSGAEGNTLWSVEVPGIVGGALMAKLGHDGRPF